MLTRLPRSSLVGCAVSTALFMHLADTAALATALPVLARELGSSPLKLKFVLTTYLVVSAIFIPASGWVADRWGAKRVFILSQLLFLSGSILCALSNNFEQLLGARVLQGIGAGMMVPVSRVIVVACATRIELVRALNWYAIPAIMGPMVGPTIAGLLLEYASWRWIFLINIPIGLLGMALVLRLVPSLNQTHPGRFDFRGAFLAGLSILGIMTLMDTIGLKLLSNAQLILLLLATILVTTLAVRHIRCAENPVLTLSLLELPTYRASLVGGGVLIMGMGATTFMLPLMLQTVFGWSPLASGLVLLWGATGAIAGRFTSIMFIRKLGFRKLTATFAGISAIGTTFPAYYHVTTPALIILALTMLNGVLRTTHFAAANALAFAEVESDFNSRASSLLAVSKQLAESVGISLAALLIIIATDGDSANIENSTFFLPFLFIGLLALIAVPGYLALPGDAGAEMRMQQATETN